MMNEEKNPKEIERLKQLIEDIKKEVDEKWIKILKAEKEKHGKLLKDLQHKMNLKLQEALDKIQELKESIRQKDQNLDMYGQTIAILGEKIEQLSVSPHYYAVVIKVHEREKMATIVNSVGQEMKVNIVNDEILQNLDTLKPGQEVLLNFNFHIIELGNDKILNHGLVVRIKQITQDGAHAILEGQQNAIVYIHSDLYKTLEPGDAVLLNTATKFIFEKIELEEESQKFLLAEIPDVTWEDIGGLDPEIQTIMQEFFWATEYKDLFDSYKKNTEKGALFIGPPGCGKTLIARAIAHEHGAHFVAIGGPELESMWVGETGRKLREIFALSEKHKLLIIFFDEIDSFVPTRTGDPGRSHTQGYVTQLSVLLDGIKKLDGVIVLAATNKPDLIDPAIKRYGRLGLKVFINRPSTPERVKDIFRIYLTPDLPFHPNTLNGESPEKAVEKIISKAADFIFTKNETTELVEVFYHDGTTETFYFADFISGSLIEAIVEKAKMKAIRNEIEGGQMGITMKLVLQSIKEIYFLSQGSITPDALEQEFILRPGKRPVDVNPLVEMKKIEKERGKLEEPPRKTTV